MNKNGFTLIELLVVIAIIGVLSTIVFTTINRHRLSASDAKRMNELRQIAIALQLFFSTYNRMPKNYNAGECSLGYCHGFDAPGNTVGLSHFAACDAFLPNLDQVGNETMHSPQAYEASMQELVSAGLLSTIPRSSDGSGYCYFDTGTNAYLATQIVSFSSSIPNMSPTCSSWCNQTFNANGATNTFCICQSH